MTYFSKTLTFAISFKPIKIGLSYFTCAILVIRPFCWYRNFWPRDLELHVWPTFKKLSLGHKFWTDKDRAFLFHMCNPCEKIFLLVLWFLTSWPWPSCLTYFYKTLNLATKFELLELGLPYLLMVASRWALLSSDNSCYDNFNDSYTNIILISV